MRRRVFAAALLAVTAAVAVLAGARGQSAEGGLDDRDLARVFGGGSSTGCVVSATTQPTCKGVAWTCPQDPCTSAYNAAPPGCTATGTWWSNTAIHTLELPGPSTPNTRIPLYKKVDCSTPASCKAGGIVNNAQCKLGVCTGTYFKFQCMPCSTQWGLTVQADDGYCQDP